jgi:ABC-2 type transport system ATP-binding protein
MKALRIQNLQKTYESGQVALKGIDLEVEQGDFFALLGPNGAGKTTTIGIITSLVNKNAGTVSIFDYDIDQNFPEAKTFIGVVPQEYNFNIFEKVLDILVNQAGFYGISRTLALVRAEYYLKKLGLWEKRYQSARSLSGGMKRRLMIARALVHEPKMLILDEPTAGVDIEVRRSMWIFLQELNKQGVTIILTTHNLEEAETLCRKIAIIDKGKIVENTTVKELLKRLNTETILFDLQNPIYEPPNIPGCDTEVLDDTTLSVTFPRTSSLNEIFSVLSANNLEVNSMRNKTNRLEELFLQLTNKPLADIDNVKN